MRHFTGREAELAALTRLLDAADAHGHGMAVVSAIGGTAGVGKTALAVHWAHQVAGQFPDGQLYVNLRGYDPALPMSPADAIGDLTRAIGICGDDPDLRYNRALIYQATGDWQAAVDDCTRALALPGADHEELLSLRDQCHARLGAPAGTALTPDSNIPALAQE